MFTFKKLTSSETDIITESTFFSLNCASMSRPTNKQDIEDTECLYISYITVLSYN